jgi:hypothetical protein
MIKYRTSSYGSDIEIVEVLRETELCVFLPPTRRRKTEERAAKVSEWHRYHDSWEAAHDHLLDRATQKVLSMRQGLALAESKLSDITRMTKPVESR